jgi:voltage-dependent potassium channel beta subunit
MEYRRLGKSGLKLSALSYGSWVTFSYQLDERAAARIMGAAYDAGVNFFDNAEAYAAGASERIMGGVLRRMAWRRDSYCVSSKVFWGGELPTQRGLSRKHVHEACHAALERLQLDYLDLFFCHRPDHETPIEETVRAMDVLVRAGKVLYWGTSEWSADQIVEAHAVARREGLTPPTMEQPQFSLLHRERVERDLPRVCDEYGLGLTTWSPLASGALAGKYDDGVPAGSRLSLPGYGWLKESVLDPGHLDRSRRLRAVAAELGISRPQLAIAWCLRNPNVSSVILGASRVEQLEEDLASLDKVGLLTPEIMQRIDDLLQNRPAPPPQF